MAKTETFQHRPDAILVAATGRRHGDYGRLIGFMGFYVLYPLTLLSINSFQHRDDCRAGVMDWSLARSVRRAGIWRSLWNSVKIGIVLQVIACRGNLCSWLLPHELFFSPTCLSSASGFVFSAQLGDHVRLDADARSEHGIDQFLAAPVAVFERAQFRHLFFLGNHLGPCWSTASRPKSCS
jgi:hypothetical protein